MCEQCDIGNINGIDRLVEWFGGRPCFHDAEVVAVELVRGAPSHIRVHAWNTDWDRVDEEGHFDQDRHALVDFRFERLTNLSLTEFSQNVISALKVQQNGDAVQLVLEPCYGLSGFIEGVGLSVDFKPGQPSAD